MDKKSYFYIIIASSLWGCIGVFFKVLKSVGFTEIQIVTLRVTSALIVLSIYIFIKDKSLFRVKASDLWCFIGTGIISLLFFNWCYFTAIELTSLAVAAVLLYTSPIFVMLFSAVLFNEKITSNKLLALVITFLGCILVTGILGKSNMAVTNLGIIIGLSSGIGYALYSIFGRYALAKGYSSITISEYTFLFASLGSISMCNIKTTLPLLINSNTLIGVLGIGVLSCVFPFVLYTKGLSNIDTSKAAIIATLEPAIASILSAVFYDENLFNTKGIGIIFIFISVILLNYNKEKNINHASALISNNKS